MGKKLAVVGSDNLYHLGAKAYMTVDGVHRSAKKMYLTKNGVHNLVFGGGGIDIAGMVIGYSAADGMQDAGVVTMGDGKQYRLLTLTKSGTLTVPEEVQAEVWMCGGGANGGNGYTDAGAPGGAGAFTATGTVSLSGESVAVIGAGNMGESSFKGLVTPTNFTVGANSAGQACGYGGGTGGGGSQGWPACKGDGVDKHPFGDSAYFPNAHCAGGGGGGLLGGAVMSPISYVGGTGGTNGGNGGAASRTSGVGTGGSGGEYGGGEGGYGQVGSGKLNGSAATFYGSGGGGAGSITFAGGYGTGGSGYQGVIYVRIPVEQAA